MLYEGGPEVVKDRRDVESYFDRHAATYHESYTDEGTEYPANYFRMRITLDLLKKRQDVKRVFDVGCGGCEPMVELLKAGFEVEGIDFSQNMLDEGHARLTENGFEKSRAWKDDFLKQDKSAQDVYDAVLMLGVLGYNKDDDLTMEKVSEKLRGGGVTIVEFPNELFSAFSFNQFSVDFYMERLLRADALPKELREEMGEFFRTKFDQNIAKDAYAEKKKCPGSDLSYPTYNPLTVHELFERHGMRLVRNHFYHYHALPPIWEYRVPELFNELSRPLEKSDDWRGHFLCSVFLAEAEKA